MEAAMDITSQIAEGDSPADIATDPLNYLYPAFADQTPKLTRGLPSNSRKVASLGLGKLGLRGLSRFGGSWIRGIFRYTRFIIY